MRLESRLCQAKEKKEFQDWCAISSSFDYEGVIEVAGEEVKLHFQKKGQSARCAAWQQNFV